MTKRKIIFGIVSMQTTYLVLCDVFLKQLQKDIIYYFLYPGCGLALPLMAVLGLYHISQCKWFLRLSACLVTQTDNCTYEILKLCNLNCSNAAYSLRSN